MENAGAKSESAERKGLGTPATRAAVIEKLVRTGFLERTGDKKTKYLIPTRKGISLMTVIPKQLKSPDMTADWEEKLMKIEKGQYSAEKFTDEIKTMLLQLIRNYKVVEDSDIMISKEYKSVGTCPVCGNKVISKSRGFFCTNKYCRFALWKNNRFFESIGKTLTSDMAEKLLKEKSIELKGCKSQRTGRSFNAKIMMSIGSEEKPEFSMDFEKGEK